MGKEKDVEAAPEAPPATIPGRAPGAPPPREAQYGPDGELLGGPHTMQQQAAQRRLQQTQAQVDEVVDIMKTNMDKVLERDHLIGDLTERAEALEEGASSFKSQAASLKNKFWLENLKMMIVMGLIGVIIIGILYVRYSGDDAPAAPAAPAPVAPAAPAPTEAAVAPVAGKCKQAPLGRARTRRRGISLRATQTSSRLVRCMIAIQPNTPPRFARRRT